MAEEPLDVARTAIQAANAGDWERVAALTDGDDLAAWYHGYADVEEEPLPPVTAADMKRWQPELPDAVAEYQAERLNRDRAGGRGSLHGQFAGLSTRAELRRVRPEEALARYLRAQDVRWQFDEQIRAQRPEAKRLALPESPSMVRSVVGAVGEGDDVAHVVYRSAWSGDAGQELPPGTPGDMHVVTVRRGPDGWRLRLTGELFEHGGSVMVTVAPVEDGGEHGEGDAAAAPSSPE